MNTVRAFKRIVPIVLKQIKPYGLNQRKTLDSNLIGANYYGDIESLYVPK